MEVTNADIKANLETSGLPVAYKDFPEEEAPQLPYICYRFPYNNNFAADGQVYFAANHVQIELYTKHKDPETEEKVETALSSFFWEKTENYIDSERCYQIIYELEV